MSENVSLILTASVPLLVVVCGLVGSFLVKSINRATQFLVSKTDVENLQYAITAVNEVAENVVKSLNQTVVDDLRKQSEDGRLTEDDMIEIANKAINTVRASLSNDIIAILDRAYLDSTRYLNDIIEAKVWDAKKIEE